jgi:hypothetical protein
MAGLIRLGHTPRIDAAGAGKAKLARSSSARKNSFFMVILTWN